MRKLCPIGLACVFLVFVAATPASAGCNASLNCNNGCSMSFVCPDWSWLLSCSSPNQIRSCSGNTSCLVGSNYVQCDGVRTYCSAAPQCSRTMVSVTCGSTTASCSTCTYGAPGCLIAP